MKTSSAWSAARGLYFLAVLLVYGAMGCSAGDESIAEDSLSSVDETTARGDMDAAGAAPTNGEFEPSLAEEASGSVGAEVDPNAIDGAVPMAIGDGMSPEVPSDAGGQQAEFLAAGANLGSNQQTLAVIEGTARLQGAPENGHGGIRVESIGTPFATVTTSTGLFRLMVNPGEQTLMFSSPGYGTINLETGNLGEGQLFQITEAVVLTSEPGRISGRVVLPTGFDGPGILMTVRVDLFGIDDPREGEPIAFTSVDDQGEFAFEAVQPADYVLRTTAPGFEPSLALVSVMPGTRQNVGLVTLESENGVTAQATAIEGVAKLQDVTAEDGHGGIRIEAVGTPFAAVTTSAGSFRLMVTPGQHDLKLSYPGYGQQVFVGALVEPGSTFTLLEEIVLAAQPGKLRGTVVLPSGYTGNEQLEQVSVELRGLVATDTNLPIATASLDPNARFAMDNVTPGEYELTVTAPGFLPNRRTIQIQPAQVVELGDLYLQRDAAEDATVVVTGYAKLAGRTEGDRHQGILVEVLNTPDETSTDAAGAYRLELAPGTHTLQMSYDGYGAVTHRLPYLAAGATVETETVVLSAAPGAITGVVVLPGQFTDQRVLDSVVIEVRAGSGLNWSDPIDAPSEIEPVPQDEENWDEGLDHDHGGQSDQNSALDADLDPDPNGPAIDIPGVADDAGGMAEGDLPPDVDPGGDPAGDPDRQPNAVPDAPPAERDVLDAESRFLITGIVPGQYQVTIRAPGFVSIESIIQVAPGEELDMGTQVLQLDEDRIDGSTAIVGKVTLEVPAGAPAGPMDHGGIRVEVLGQPFVAFTNRDGEFRLDCIPGTHTILFYMPGYSTRQLRPEDILPGAIHSLDPITLYLAGDGDFDGVGDDVDNCRWVSNADQTNADGDAEGDACDDDDDGDGLLDAEEILLSTNPLKADTDQDGLSDYAEIRTYGTNPLAQDTDVDGLSDLVEYAKDLDGDGLNNAVESNVYDSDGDGAPNHLDGPGPFGDLDGDGILNGERNDEGLCTDDQCDNCIAFANAAQLDADDDGRGDACDHDDDDDGEPDATDNCRTVPNADQIDTDGDTRGDACDQDDDGDGLSDEKEHDAGSNPLRVDTDLDGIVDGDGVIAVDNCIAIANADQIDSDGDGQGDDCDTDDDNDGVPDSSDNCPYVANADGRGAAAGAQLDNDSDGVGDACDVDDDNDAILDPVDNCPLTANTLQSDYDVDGIGDSCDDDDDADDVKDVDDNCPFTYNPDQADTSGDGVGDLCSSDRDTDGVTDGRDNCPELPNPEQDDMDADGVGDSCDDDIDGDGLENGDADNCDAYFNPNQADLDGDQLGDACDVDDDNDGLEDDIDSCPRVKNLLQDPDGDNVDSACDNCPASFNVDQRDLDTDGEGDVCDDDMDGDDITNDVDNCPRTVNAEQHDKDGDGQGDACSVFFVNHLSDRDIRDMASDADSVWIASAGGATHWRFDHQSGEYETFRYTTANGMPSNDVKAVDLDNDGNAYFVTDKGLWVYTPINGQWSEVKMGLDDIDDCATTPPTEMRQVAVNRDTGSIYVTFVGGVVHGGPGNWNCWPAGAGMADAPVKRVDLAPNGDVWVSTELGAARYREGTWTRFGPPRISSATVHGIGFIGDEVWISTDDGASIIAADETITGIAALPSLRFEFDNDTGEVVSLGQTRLERFEGNRPYFRSSSHRVGIPDRTVATAWVSAPHGDYWSGSTNGLREHAPIAAELVLGLPANGRINAVTPGPDEFIYVKFEQLQQGLWRVGVSSLVADFVTTATNFLVGHGRLYYQSASGSVEFFELGQQEQLPLNNTVLIESSDPLLPPRASFFLSNERLFFYRESWPNTKPAVFGIETGSWLSPPDNGVNWSSPGFAAYANSRGDYLSNGDGMVLVTADGAVQDKFRSTGLPTVVSLNDRFFMQWDINGYEVSEIGTYVSRELAIGENVNAVWSMARPSALAASEQGVWAGQRLANTLTETRTDGVIVQHGLPLPNGVVSYANALAVDKNGNLWIGNERLERALVNRIVNNFGPFQRPQSLLSGPDGRVHCIAMTTSFSVTQHKTFVAGSRFNQVDGLFEEQVLGWTALSGSKDSDSPLNHSGLARGYERYGRDEGLAGDLVRDLEEARDGSIWVATESGISRITGMAFTNYDLGAGNDVQKILQDREDRIWAATTNGVYVYEGNSFEAANGTTGEVTDLSLGPDGRLWAATSEGLFRRTEARSFTRYPLGQEPVRLIDVETMNDGRIIVGTDNDGVFIIHSHGQVDHLTAQSAGLPSDDILDVFAEQIVHGKTWVATAEGLAQYVAEPPLTGQSICGDGLVAFSEACDDGGASDTCTADCTLADEVVISIDNGP